jgi:4-diphosphocytidyl-2-C-methyl-D-erythritol kinase
MQLAAYAKVNLTLDVLFKRPDGYHELAGIYHTVNLFDTVEIEKSNGVRVECDIPLPENNTAYRAACEYIRLAGCGGAHIRVIKRIPSEAGLGGASADAAAVLRGMQRLYGSLDETKLAEAALRIGADVPFCLSGGTALARGVGEILTPLPHPGLHFLVVRDGPGISTKALFSELSLPLRHPDNTAAEECIRKNDVRGLGSRMFNALEPAAIPLCPNILEIKQRMLYRGALGACMTGSGSAVIGLFENAKKAQSAAKTFDDCAFAKVTESTYQVTVM